MATVKESSSPSPGPADEPNPTSCGIPRIDLRCEASLAAAERDADEDAGIQFKIWDSLTRNAIELPHLKNSSWSSWSASFSRLVNATNSAYLFQKDEVSEEITESHIHRARHAWISTALAKCCPPHPTRDDLEDPKDLLHWIVTRFKTGAITETTSIVGLLRTLRARPDEKLTDFYSRFSGIIKRLHDDVASVGSDAYIDRLLKATAFHALSSSRPKLAEEWIDENSDIPVNQLLDKAIWKAVNMPSVGSGDAKGKGKGIAKSLRCRYCKAEGHEKENCHKKKAADKARGQGKTGSGTVNSVPTENENVPTPCIGLYELDSGSPIHISANRAHFQSFSTSSELQRSITGHNLKVRGIGTIQISQPSYGLSITLHDVRFCPDAASNIVSVSALEKSGFKLDWQSSPAPVRILQQDENVARFFRVNSGFYAKFRVSNTINTVAHPAQYADLWHRRFAHINHRYVKNSTKYHGAVPDSVCETCVQAKQTKSPGSKLPSSETKPFDRVFVDLGGGLNSLPDGVSADRVKSRHFILFTDEATRFRWVYHLGKKPDTTQSIETFLAMVKTQFDATPKALRSDGGREFNNDQIRDLLNRKGTLWEPTAAKAPEQNGVSERSMRTLMQTVRAMIFSSSIPRKYWPYALDTAVYLWNRTSNQKQSPYELLHGSAPAIDHIRVFGCVAYAHDPSHKSKLDPRSKVMCLVGFGSSRVFLLLDPRTGSVVRRRDVVFDEQKYLDWSIYDRSSDQQIVQYETPSLKNVSAIVTHPSHAVPSSYREATHCADADEWQEAMKHEIDQLSVNETWKLVPRSEIPKSAKLLTGKWVYRRKDDGSYKARWVVRGFNEDDLDIGDTYAATLQATTVRMLFAWAVQKGYFIRQADISSAFLNSPVDRDVFVLQPTGFAAGRHVCKLSRSLYGLRTAPKDWYDTLSSFLLTLGFKASKHDQCLFHRGNVALSVFVDDINIFGPDDDELSAILQTINKRFKLRDMGCISRYLGMDVNYDRAAGKLTINQAPKIRQLLEECGLQSAIPRGTPIDPGATIPLPPASDEHPAVGEHEHAIFRARLGSLLHIACFTRPDIMFSVMVLTRVQNAPTDAAINALLYLLRYLKGTISISITFVRNKDLCLTGFSDSSWATKTDARSTSGVIFTINGAPVLWHSKLQTVIARSTCEAEYVAADLAAREATWLQLFWHEICRLPTSSEPAPIPLNTDSQSALALAQKEGVQTRNRHFLIRVEALREAEKRRIIQLNYIPSTSMAADGFTKVLTASGQKHFLKLINMC